jgi:hypothetical protein
MKALKAPAAASGTVPTSAPLSGHWRITAVLLGLVAVLTKHYPLQDPVHVGMFAGSLLQHGDWDHSHTPR